MMDKRDWLLWLRGAGIFALCFLATLFVLPQALFKFSSLIPGWLQGLILFGPQIALLPYGVRGDFGSMMHITVPAWCLVALIYGFLTVRLKTRYVAILAYPAWIGLVFLENWVLQLLGLSVYLDGP